VVLTASLSVAAAPAVPSGGLRPVPGADRHNCDDTRFPALAGPWIAACGPDGAVDRVISVVNQQEFPLPVAHLSPALGDRMVYVPGMAGGAWRLTETGPVAVSDLARVARAPAAPAATDGQHFVVLGQTGVEAWSSGDTTRRTWATQAREYQAPALAWPWVAWVADGPAGGQVWVVDVRETNPKALSAPTVDARHPVGTGVQFWWVEDGVLVTLYPLTGRKDVVAKGPTGFSAPLSAWQDVVCWEERGAEGVDVHCSDGLGADGPGDQQWPSRYDRWLLYRDNGRARLAEQADTATPISEVPPQ
jgi:hypothetical protein